MDILSKVSAKLEQLFDDFFSTSDKETFRYARKKFNVTFLCGVSREGVVYLTYRWKLPELIFFFLPRVENYFMSLLRNSFYVVSPISAALVITTVGRKLLKLAFTCI